MEDKLKWLKERQKGIGGSDVGAILGINKWKSPFEVYIDKTEEITEIKEAGEAAYWGSILEDQVAKEFALRTGKKVRKDNRHLIHKKYKFMTANIDRRIVSENAILECKTVNSFGAKEWEGEEVPPSYIVQCQHYLEVTGCEKCYIAVLIGGQKFMFKEILRDDELIAMIIEKENDFWLNHVEKGIPPAIDGSESAAKYINNKFNSSDSSLEISLKSEYKEHIEDYFSLKDKIKALEYCVKEIENNIKNELGNAEKGIINQFSIAWKSIISQRVDSKVLKAKYPDIYKEVCRECATRRFEIKEISELSK